MLLLRVDWGKIGDITSFQLSLELWVVELKKPVPVVRRASKTEGARLEAFRALEAGAGCGVSHHWLICIFKCFKF